MTPEKAAEECSQKWAITAIKEIGRPLYDLPSDVIKDIKYRLKQAFLAGHAAALRPRKIDEQEPEPYKNVMLFDGKEWWYGHFDCACNLYVYYYGDGTRDDKIFTHWLPLPPTPQREGE